MDQEKYTEHAKEYERYRTGYPQALYRYLIPEFGISKDKIIADIGSGTGKLSRPFIEQGNEVYCVEPNAGMRTVAEEIFMKYSNFHSINGSAEDTVLGDHSVDYVMVGTAFHWFNEEKFHKECKRILKPGGKVILVWISRPVNVINDELGQELFQINDQGRSGGKEETPERFERFFLPGTMQYNLVTETVCFQKDTFIERVISTFHQLDSAQNREKIEKLFEGHSKNDTLEIPLYVRCISGDVG